MSSYDGELAGREIKDGIKYFADTIKAIYIMLISILFTVMAAQRWAQYEQFRFR